MNVNLTLHYVTYSVRQYKAHVGYKTSIFCWHLYLHDLSTICSRLSDTLVRKAIWYRGPRTHAIYSLYCSTLIAFL